MPLPHESRVLLRTFTVFANVVVGENHGAVLSHCRKCVAISLYQCIILLTKCVAISLFLFSKCHSKIIRNTHTPDENAPLSPSFFSSRLDSSTERSSTTRAASSTLPVSACVCAICARVCLPYKCVCVCVCLCVWTLITHIHKRTPAMREELSSLV